jgi:hypothetical protein
MQPYYVQFDAMGIPRIVPSNVPTGNNMVGYLGQANLHQGPTGDVTDISSLNQTANGLAELATLHNTLLVNNLLVSSGTGSDAAAQSPTYVVQRPWLSMPEGGVPFDQSNTVNMPAVGLSAVVVTLIVPDGYDGVINAYSWNDLGGGFTSGSGDLQVQLLRNGAPIRNYDNILVEKGTPEIPRQISPLRIYSGQTIQIVINHLANPLLAGNINGSLVGYFYPSMS